MHRKSIVFIAALSFSCAFAGGQYFNLDAGLSILAENPPFYSTGWDTSLAIGYQKNPLRFELQGNYSAHHGNAQLENLSFQNLGTLTFGRLEMVSFLGNIIYDFHLNCRYIPYIGTGFGIGDIWTSLSVRNVNLVNLFSQNFSHLTFAFQGIFGVDYKISESLRFGIRDDLLFWTPNNNFNFITNPNNIEINTTNTNQTRGFFNQSNFENRINIGFTLSF